MNFISKKDEIDIGKYSFYLGVFLLPAAFPISGIFLTISLFCSFLKDKSVIFKDKINFSVVISIGLVLVSTIFNFAFQLPKALEDSTYKYLWLNIFNWIPALLCFIAFQNYLKTKKDRLNFSKIFIAGTIPIIASCLFQLFFDISGPFEIFNGLIVWFQKPLSATGGISGLFSNRNYTGFWLAVSLPFSLYLFKKNPNLRVKSISAFLISCIVFYLTILTNSRNAFVGLTSTLIIFFGTKSILVFILLISLFVLMPNILPTINPNLTMYFPTVFERFGATFSMNTPRVVIFKSAINYILQRPLLGWGAGTFFLIFTNKENILIPPFQNLNPQHTHNLFLEMAYNFGLPTSILITSISIIIFLKAIPFSFYSKYDHESFNIDKAWLCAILVVFLMYLSDVTFYDGRISLLTSILFSGLRCIPLSPEIIENTDNNP